MKQWQETARVLDQAIRLGEQGRASALAIVTRIRGSAYRRPGAKLLIEDRGGVIGGVSGGCLEEDVRQHGLAILNGGGARLLHYDTSDDERSVFGLGLGCDGKIDLLVLPMSAEAALGPWRQIRGLLDGELPIALATFAEDGAGGGVLAVGGPGLLVDGLNEPAVAAEAAAAALVALGSGRSGFHSVGARRLFVEVLEPPPKLLVCGAGEDARPLVTLAASVGFRVSVADHRATHLSAEMFPEARRLVLTRPEEVAPGLPEDAATYAVVKTHSLKNDTAWVRRLLRTPVPYIGVLGPRGRTRRILEETGTVADDRVFGPVGLDLNADGAEQVALSVVAEVMAVRSKREPAHLREREVAVHAGV